MPNTFQFLCYKDEGRTSRLEVTVIKGEVLADAQDGTGTKVHSKSDSGNLPEADYAKFFDDL